MTASPRRPRAVFFGKVGPLIDPAPDLERKLGIQAANVEPIVLTTGVPGVRSVCGNTVVSFPAWGPHILATALYYALAPIAAVILAAWRPPSAIVCQSPFEGATVWPLLRLIPPARRPGLVIEVHGDWRASTRLYGTSLRRLVAPLADVVAEAATRRADLIRTIGSFTGALVHRTGYRGDVDTYITFSNFEDFLAAPPAPLPSTPRAAFVGALEMTKGVDVLIDAWRAVSDTAPHAHLVIAGDGRLRRHLESQAKAAGLATRITFVGRLARAEVSTLLDESSLLVLPSRSEGLGRVALEAMARGRAVVGSDVGGISEFVTPNTGVLVPSGDADQLAGALSEVLGDQERLAELGRRGREAIEERSPIQDFADGIARLAAWTRTASWQRRRSGGTNR